MPSESLSLERIRELHRNFGRNYEKPFERPAKHQWCGAATLNKLISLARTSARRDDEAWPAAIARFRSDR
jgi:hypothetical protein